MDLLVGKHVIAVNKIYLAYPHTRMRPSYYVVADKRIACEVAPYLNSIACPKFIEYWAADSWCKDDSVIVLRRHPDATLPFSRNLLSGTVGGATVLFTALQIAYYLGFDRVVLLGLDFAYTGMERTGQVSAAGEVMVTSSAANYFIKEYSPVGRVTSAPRLSEQRAAFAAAHAAFSASGRTLVNASRQTALDSIPRARLEEYI